MKKIVIIGSGGHADSVKDSIHELKKYKFIGFIDPFKKIDDQIIANDINDSNVSQFSKYSFIVAIGNNKIRTKWFEKIKKYNLNLISIIDKSACISKKAKIGEGVFIGKNSTITSSVIIEDNCIINSASVIEHGVTISKNSNISPGAIINGDVKIEENVWVGSGAIIFGQIKIGKNSIVGAGSLVRKDVSKNVVVVGSPAKLLKKVKDE